MDLDDEMMPYSPSADSSPSSSDLDTEVIKFTYRRCELLYLLGAVGCIRVDAVLGFW
jgi:hypothetical protein